MLTTSCNYQDFQNSYIENISFLVSDEKCVGTMSNAPKLIETKKPDCKISTEFPFTDIQSNKWNIDCHSILTLENVTMTDTAIYTCRARIAFKTISSETYKSNRHQRKINTFERYVHCKSFYCKKYNFSLRFFFLKSE